MSNTSSFIAESELQRLATPTVYSLESLIEESGSGPTHINQSVVTRINAAVRQYEAKEEPCEGDVVLYRTRKSNRQFTGRLSANCGSLAVCEYCLEPFMNENGAVMIGDGGPVISIDGTDLQLVGLALAGFWTWGKTKGGGCGVNFTARARLFELALPLK